MKELEPEDKYKCSVCSKMFTNDEMVYIKPEILGRDYFSDIGSLCYKCAWSELDRLIKKFPIPKSKKENLRWISGNVAMLAKGDFRLTRHVEDIMLICSILINNSND